MKDRLKKIKLWIANLYENSIFLRAFTVSFCIVGGIAAIIGITAAGALVSVVLAVACFVVSFSAFIAGLFTFYDWVEDQW